MADAKINRNPQTFYERIKHPKPDFKTLTGEQAHHDYIIRQLRWALSLTNDEHMRFQAGMYLEEAGRSGVVIPEDVTKKLVKLLTEPVSRPRGGQFGRSFHKALRIGQADSLVTHVGMNKTLACTLVAAAWSTEKDKPLDPKTILNKWNEREVIYQECLFETCGHFSFRPFFDKEIDAAKFSKQKRRAIIDNCPLNAPERDKLIAFLSSPGSSK